MALEKVPILRYLEHYLRGGNAQYASTLLRLTAFFHWRSYAIRLSISTGKWSIGADISLQLFTAQGKLGVKEVHAVLDRCLGLGGEVAKLEVD
ncbi:MAG: hypothetical protein NTX45_06545 [Proteobacteria bacterium]|nr:hypothetical protein [Pseudomonadota bacterium]